MGHAELVLEGGKGSPLTTVSGPTAPIASRHRGSPHSPMRSWDPLVAAEPDPNISCSSPNDANGHIATSTKLSAPHRRCDHHLHARLLLRSRRNVACSPRDVSFGG